MNKNFISRKTSRKNKRIEKKQKMNTYYHKNNTKLNLDTSNNSKNTIKWKKQIKDYNNDDDEDIDSSIISDKDSENQVYEDDKENYEHNDPDEENNKIDNNDDIDNEIRNLEKKLGLKQEKNYNQYKKRLTMENHDPDLMDFLDNIDRNINEIKYTKVKKSSEPVQNIINKKEEPIETLDQIKAKSKLFSSKNINDEDQIKLSFQKDITSMLNKISEANLNLMFSDFIKKLDEFEMSKIKYKSNVISETISKVSLKLMLDNDITNLPITSCICSYLSVLHYKYGNSFMLFFFKLLFDKFEEFVQTQKRSQMKNFIFTIIQFYIYQNLSSKLFYDLIKFFIENFNDIYSELLLIMLTYIGIDIRKEDPDSLKEIISSVHIKYNNIIAENKINNKESNISSKIKYLVEMIDEIKNNKYMKFNATEKFSFFKNFVNTQKKNFYNESDINSKTFADRIDITIEMIKEIDKNNIQDFTHINQIEENKDKQIDIDDNIISIDNTKIDKLLKKFKITTDLKKKIFISIINSSDYIDAFESLIRLNLKKDQSREIIKIIVLLAIEEKCYNPFYKLLIDKLIFVDKSHKYTFHYTIWDHLKVMDNYNSKKLHNLANLLSDLLNVERISLPVFLPFEFDDANKNQVMFVNFAFDMYFDKTIVDKCKLLFAKLVKNDDHVEFGKQLFNYLIKLFKKEVNFENKSKEYIENFTAAIKVLKKIL